LVVAKLQRMQRPDPVEVIRDELSRERATSATLRDDVARARAEVAELRERQSRPSRETALPDAPRAIGDDDV
jgi:hypothetical protein